MRTLSGGIDGDFDALPVAIQRKYFSTLERLRIEQSALQQPHRSRSSRPPPPLFHNPSPFGLPERSDTCPRRRLRKRQALQLEYNISQAEARWFFSLPEKIRRRHFSREEQVLLAGRCETYICPADEQLPYRVSSEQSSRPLSKEDNCQDCLGNDQESSPARGRSRKRSYSLDEFRFFDDVEVPISRQKETASTASEDTDMSPPVPLAESPQAPPRSQRSHHSRHSSFRRTLSLTQIPFGRHSTSSAPPSAGPPFLPVGQQPWRRRAQSSSSSDPRTDARHYPMPLAPAFDPEATHYQDPEARKKLRHYLASPQKFDEAIEFGFPSASATSAPPRLELPEITADSRKFSHDLQTFLKEDNASFLQDDDDAESPETDDESVADIESPITPSDVGASFRQYTTARMPSSHISSIDSTGLPPSNVTYYRSKSQDMYSQGILGNREMTLRMTLTRPDLRADEDALYGWQGMRGGGHDPLALEELQLSDDMTGAKGAFAVKPHKGIVSRFLRRIKK